MNETQTMDVIVHKNINLQIGETLSQFTRGLRESAREHIMKKLNIAPPTTGKANDGGAYMVEVFSKSVVMDVWKGAGPDKYYAFAYERDPQTKVFKFGDASEVERVTSFKAKPGVTLTKADAVSIAKSTTGDSSFSPVVVSSLESADGNLWAPKAAHEHGELKPAV